MPPPRAYSYVRFSTPEQMKGDSLRRQIDLSARYASDNGLILDEELSYRDLGVSAYDESNVGVDGDLRKFLDAVKQGHVPVGSYLLVESLDRLTRANIMSAVDVLFPILRSGITVVTLADGMTYRGTGDDQAILLSLVMSLLIMSRAHEESATKSKRVKEAWSEKRRNLDSRKLTKVCPAWLRLSKDGKAYEFVPDRVAVVRRIITMMRAGLGRGAIVRRLNAEGVRSIAERQPNRKKRGRDITPVGECNTWFESYVKKIVTNRALIGEFRPHMVEGGRRLPVGTPIADYFPRVVSNEEFAVLQELLRSRGRPCGGTRGKSFANLFTGIVRCGYCGSAMIHIDKGLDRRRETTSRANRFLVCGVAKRGAGCYYVPWSYLDFEEAFFAYAQHTDFANFVRTTNDSGTELRSIHDQITIEESRRADLVVQQARLVAAIKEANTAKAAPRAVLEAIDEIESDVKSCDDRLAMLKQQVGALTGRQSLSDAALTALQEVSTALRDKTGEELFTYRTQLNEYLRRVIDRIALFPGGTIHSAIDVDSVRTRLLESGQYTKSAVEKYVAAALRTAPARHERFFVIKNRYRKIRMLEPDGPVPDIFEVLEQNPGFFIETSKLTREKAEAAVADELTQGQS